MNEGSVGSQTRLSRRWSYLYFPVLAAVPCAADFRWVAVALLLYFAVFLSLARQRRYDLGRWLKNGSPTGERRLRDQLVPLALVVLAVPTLTHGGLAPLLGFLGGVLEQSRLQHRE